MYLKWGTVGDREKGMGRTKRGEGQYAGNLGPEWTGIAPHAKEGFQVSKKGSGTGELSRQRGISRGLSRGLCMRLQYNAKLIHIVLIVLCRANKGLCLGYK